MKVDLTLVSMIVASKGTDELSVNDELKTVFAKFSLVILDEISLDLIFLLFTSRL